MNYEQIVKQTLKSHILSDISDSINIVEQDIKDGVKLDLICDGINILTCASTCSGDENYRNGIKEIVYKHMLETLVEKGIDVYLKHTKNEITFNFEEQHFTENIHNIKHIDFGLILEF